MTPGVELRFVERTRVLHEGRSYLFFGGTDYHRLASHPETVRAFQEAAWSEGLSCAGSRISSGNHPLLGRLEARAAAFLGAGEVVLAPCGYLANTVALEAVQEDFQRFFLAAGSHGSLAAPAETLPRGRVHPFRAGEPGDLARALLRHLRPGERPLVLTEGVAPGSGQLAPLADYWVAVGSAGGQLLVDDAHGIGVLGPGGQGSPAAAGLPAEACLQAGTLAKALGSFGGLVAGPQGLLAKAAGRSRAFVGATPMPPPLAASALCAIGLLQAQPELVTGLQARMAKVRARLRDLGFPVGHSPAPILSITHHDPDRNRRLRSILLEEGIFPTFNCYPGCPPGGHFRFALSSAHTDAEVEGLVRALARSCS